MADDGVTACLGGGGEVKGVDERNVEGPSQHRRRVEGVGGVTDDVEEPNEL